MSVSVDLTPIIGSTEDNAVTALALLSALIVRDFAATRSVSYTHLRAHET